MASSAVYSPGELKDMPTLCVGQCCSLKIDTGDMRVWLCRVGGGVSIERYRKGRWDVVEGGCDGPGDPLEEDDEAAR